LNIATCLAAILALKDSVIYCILIILSFIISFLNYKTLIEPTTCSSHSYFLLDSRPGTILSTSGKPKSLYLAVTGTEIVICLYSTDSYKRGKIFFILLSP